MTRVTILALLCFGTVSPSFSQDGPYRVLGGESDEAGGGPIAFLGCCYGAWSLNGADGIVLHYHGGMIEHWALVQDGASPDWYYYHEKSLDGSVDFPEYKWRFYRHFNPANPKVGVYRKYPGDAAWTHVCTACLTLTTRDALTTPQTRQAAVRALE